MCRHACPAIWLYPETECDVDVSVHFKGNGFMTVSVPPYQDKWRIHVDPSIPYARYKERFGFQTWHEFLDYDGLREGPYQKKRGWCIHINEFINWQRMSLKELGCNESEIESLVYCFGRLFVDNKHPESYLLIYPQQKEIVDQSVALEITPKPDIINRTWFYLVPTNQESKIEPPEISPIVRDGFSVVEVGYLMPRDVPEIPLKSVNHGFAFGLLGHWVDQSRF